MTGGTTETIGAAQKRGSDLLAPVVGAATAGLDARTLLLDACGYPNYTALLAHASRPLSDSAASRYESYLTARQAGQPVAYILGWREFYQHRFRTTAAALIPRPETEHLVETALWHLPEAQARQVLELGTGTGAIGISIARDRPQAQVLMTDVAQETLDLAATNKRLHNAENARLLLSDWYANLPAKQMDMIISNPPYIADDDRHLHEGDLRFEPTIALQGGADGLQPLQTIIQNAPRHLKRGGVLLVENGHEQAAAVFALFAAAGFCGISHIKDLSGYDRVTFGVLV